MKLISCHVENYGKISNLNLNFTEGLNAFCRANGYGKTTFASFIKAMFYGLNTARKNSAFADRTHFYPFGSGTFGGSLTFEADGKEYRIERTFDEKSDVKDTLTVYCNGKLIKDFGVPGERLFGIDRDSFERTAFITAEDIEIATTGDINSKLTNFVAGNDENENLVTALEALEKKSKIYKKSKQGSDLITDASRKLEELKKRLFNLRIIADGLPAKEKEVDELDKEIAKLDGEIKRAQEEKVAVNNWENYESLCADAAAKKAEIERITSLYPQGMPEQSDIDGVKEALKKSAVAAEGMKGGTLTQTDALRLNVLERRFAAGVPDGSALSKTAEDIKALDGVEREMEALGKATDGEETRKLKQRFLYRRPDESELAALDKNVADYRELEEKLKSAPDVQSYSQPEKKRATPFIIMAACAAAVLLGGVGLIFVQKVAGIILAAAGGVALLAAGFLYLNKKSAPVIIQSDGGERQKLAESLKRVTDTILSSVSPYGYNLENGALYAAMQLKQDVERFSALTASEDDRRAKLEELAARKSALEGSVKGFFKTYGLEGGDYIEMLTALRSDIDAYRDLTARKSNAEKTGKDYEEIIAECRRVILNYCKKYGVLESDAESAANNAGADLLKLGEARKAYAECTRRAEEFKREKGLTVRPASSLSLDELNEKHRELISERGRRFNELVADETEAEGLEQLTLECDECEKLLGSYKKTHYLLTAAMDFLQRADNNIKEKYIKPIREKFVEYSSVIEKALGEKMTMNADFELRFESCGKERSERHLSSGQRNICALCFRLALIDGMYPGEKPFLILDDPFMSLDEGHFSKVKDVLAAFAKDKQIIYFTCHKSRAL